MSDIVERLRVFPVQGQRPPVHAALRNEAAASIESMRELLARANAEWQGCAAELEQANRRIVAMGEMNDALAARLAEAERVILRMAGEGFARAKIYVDKYDLTGEQAARATDSASLEQSK